MLPGAHAVLRGSHPQLVQRFSQAEREELDLHLLARDQLRCRRSRRCGRPIHDRGSPRSSRLDDHPLAERVGAGGPESGDQPPPELPQEREPKQEPEAQVEPESKTYEAPSALFGFIQLHSPASVTQPTSDFHIR